jgi:hypothetical protein
LSPDERMPPNLEFFPFEDTSMCAVLPSYPQHKSDLWLEEIWQDSSFALDKTTLEPGMIFQEPIATLQKAQTAFDAYFGSYCSPPAAPPPEYLGVCCPAWVTDPWYTSTPLCQQVSSDWSADFWKQIGFFASGPQNFVYDALVTPLGANQWLVSLGAHYTLNCSTPFEGSLTRFGIAQKVGNGCAVKWLQGWHVVDMME